MSIVEGPGRVDPRQLKWGGYALALFGALAVGWAYFAPGPVSALAAILLPLASFAVALVSPALFEIRSRGRGSPTGAALRSFNPIVELPAFVLFIAALRLALASFAGPLVAAGVGAAAGGAAGFYAAQRPGVANPFALILTLAVTGALYGYGALTLADVRFDASAGRVLPVAVSNKHISQGRSTSYHLDLPAWGPRAAPSSVTVRRSIYEAVQPGDPVCITLHPGALGTAWYVVNLCSGAPSA